MLRITRGDFEGFVAAFINNLVQLLILAPLCIFVVGLSPNLVYGRILPGVAISFLVGNLYYAWLAVKLARKEGRTDVCALPYGISTPGLIAHIFLVMLPAKQLALAQGLADPERVAWQAGLVACFVGGLIEFGAAFVAEPIRRATPAAAMLATLGGIGVGFLGLSFLFQIYAAPIVGLTTMTLVFVLYFGRVSFGRKLPGTLLVLVVGTALAWATGIAPVGGAGARPLEHLGLYAPTPAVIDLWGGLTGGHILPYLSIILPIGLLGALASLQNIESAEAAGDAYPPRPCLIVNGLGTMAASFFGSPFPTSIYIGHPAWKRMGARASYSVLNGLFLLLVCLTGTMSFLAWAIPAEAGIAIVLWIGIIITAQAYEVVPKRYIPAVVIGTLPGIAAWATLTIKSILRGVTTLTVDTDLFGPALVEAAHSSGAYLSGGFALEIGFLYAAMILSAMCVCIIDRRFVRAAGWSLAAAILSLSGLLHAFKFTPGDTLVDLPLLNLLTGGFKGQLTDLFPAWQFALAYALVALLLLAAHFLTEPNRELV
jgi:AGZA family xanthine/uracil permease-like MFS transporter